MKDRTNRSTVKGVPWMSIAWHEYLLWGKNDWTVKVKGGFKRVQQYINLARGGFNAQTAGWCGCFVHWVLEKTNEIYGTSFSTVKNNPSSSQNYATRKRYPGSLRIRPRLNRIPYGSITVLHSSGWQGHVGFLINYVKAGKKRYAYLLAGNQNEKVCVQEFEVYREKNQILYRTKKGKIFSLRGYFFPVEYDFARVRNKAFKYCTEGYSIEEIIEKQEININ